jgi:hypothetical protein
MDLTDLCGVSSFKIPASIDMGKRIMYWSVSLGDHEPGRITVIRLESSGNAISCKGIDQSCIDFDYLYWHSCSLEGEELLSERITQAL